MTSMLAPDLLDRRALAHLAFVDALGRAVRSPVAIDGDRVSTARKQDGTIALLSAGGFEKYSATFDAPPGSPSTGSKSLELVLKPTDAKLMSRMVTLALPRDPRAKNRGKADSLFTPVKIVLLPSVNETGDGFSSLVRVSLRRKSDKASIGNALIEGKTDDGKFSAISVTDSRGEAALLFANLPLTFPAAQGSIKRTIKAKIIARVDDRVASFEAVNASSVQVAAETLRPIDPDSPRSGTQPDFSLGQSVELSAGTVASVAIEWSKP